LASDTTAIVVSVRDFVHCLVLNTTVVSSPTPEAALPTSVLPMVSSVRKLWGIVLT
jgi:hypothetical protein